MGTSLLMLVMALVADRYLEFDISGDFEGMYILKSWQGKQFLLTDHLIVGEGVRRLHGIDFKISGNNTAALLFPKKPGERGVLHCERNPWHGTGLVSNRFPDGTGLVTYLGKYLDDDQQVHGLFVGGGALDSIRGGTNVDMNNSGMTYFDGKRWFHIWCSVNEGIGSARTGMSLTPSKWEFIGSGVEQLNNNTVVLTSKHKVVIDGIPVNIRRRIAFAAGQPYFNLEIKITNAGAAALFYSYDYGDEPWVGYYGTSLGDVGWVQDRIVSHEERIDPVRYSHAGMVDIGNGVIGERPVYTSLANFIEWVGPERPREVYFTNDFKKADNYEAHLPLESFERFIGLKWEGRLQPGEFKTIRLTIGMARLNPQTGIPEKPVTSWMLH